MIRRFFLQFTLAATTITAGMAQPTPEAVLDKYVDVTGGMAAYKAVKSQVMTGTIEFVGQGLKGTTTVYASLPGNSLSVIELAGIGKISSGMVDGVVWQNSAIQGARIASGKERDQTMRLMRLDSISRWQELYTDVKLEGAEDIEGKPHWKIGYVAKGGGEREFLWLDQKSGLLTRSQMTLETPMGKVPVETTVREYRQEGGRLLPVVSEQKMGPQVMRTTIDKVEVNVDIPAEKFALPAEIKALLAKEKKGSE